MLERQIRQLREASLRISGNSSAILNAATSSLPNPNRRMIEPGEILGFRVGTPSDALKRGVAPRGLQHALPLDGSKVEDPAKAATSRKADERVTVLTKDTVQASL